VRPRPARSGAATSPKSPPMRASCTWPRCLDLCGRRLLACPMSNHQDAKLTYFPRWGGCVVPGNLPIGMWRGFWTLSCARRSRGTICPTSLRVAWSRCNTDRLNALRGARRAAARAADNG
jgi:hypothetical protein